MLSGCDLISNNLKYTEPEVENTWKVEMTERQEAVFRSYGLEEERIAKMKEEGLNYKEESFVDAAIMMLDYLEEKYEESFEVVGGDIPGILSDEYWITAQALEGEYAGERFEVYFRGKEDFTDGYITLLKQDEACEAFIKLLKNNFSNILVFPYVEGEYGNELTLDNTGEELIKIVDYGFNIIVTDTDITEEEFKKMSDSIQILLEEYYVKSSGLVRYLKEPVNPNMTADDMDGMLHNLEVFRWNEYIES
jgi:hypothetical protein